MIVYKWLEHNGYRGEHNRRLSSLKILFGFFDIRPNLFIEKIKNSVRAKKQNIPLIGHLHTPKTGGTYVNHLMDNFPHVNFSHVVVRETRNDKWCPVGLVPIKPNKINGYYIFATVRNPLEFLISYYHHVLGNMGSDNIEHYDYEEAQKGFENLVTIIINREDKWPSKKFLFPNLFNQDGHIVVDWVNRNETLDDDVSSLCSKFGLVHIPKAKKRTSNKNKSEQYYTQELLNKVSKTYWREMDLFGYENFNIKIPKVNLYSFKTSNLRYDYLTDILIVD